jgi:anaerobic selenocysteine-containing dehydrogenase
LVTVVDGRAVKVVGDTQVAGYDGYTCPKGRALPQQHNDPTRLLHSLRRDSSGVFERISATQVVDEVARKLTAIIAAHGPESVALYFGSGSLGQHFGAAMGYAFFRAIKSPMTFSPTNIDKPAEKIVAALHGYWLGGAQSFESSDTWLLIGGNPIVTKSNGAPYNNPASRLKEAARRGMRLIVADPRRSETARRAALHLQVRPGEDPALLAGLVHVVIAERLYDSEFVAGNASGFDALRAAVAPFTPRYVAERVGIAVDDLLAAARMFGGGRRGMAVCSTGPSFSTHSNLSFYLALCLNTLCGRWARAGEMVANPNVLLPPFTPRAQPQGPYPVFGERRMRIGGLRETATGLPTAILPDEMLLDGPGRIRALICVGGNPMSAWPDERKTEAALRSLDLLVQIDVVMSATAKLAHYVVATPLSLEVPGTTYMVESLKYLGTGRGYELPRAQYAPAIVAPPPGSELLLEHEFFFRMAQQLGLQLEWINIHGMGRFVESPSQTLSFDMSRVPSIDELWDIATVNARIPLAEVKKHPHGKIFDLRVPVQARLPDCTDRLQLADPLMLAEIAAVAAQGKAATAPDSRFPLLLVSRRHNNFLNSVLVGLPVAMRGVNYNPLFMHPQDIADFRLADGAEVEVRSRHGSVFCVLARDESLRPGVVALTHGFGGHGREFEHNPRLAGSNVNLLIGHDEMDPISGIPRMSALPVAVTRRPSSK